MLQCELFCVPTRGSGFYHGSGFCQWVWKSNGPNSLLYHVIYTQAWLTTPRIVLYIPHPPPIRVVCFITTHHHPLLWPLSVTTPSINNDHPLISLIGLERLNHVCMNLRKCIKMYCEMYQEDEICNSSKGISQIYYYYNMMDKSRRWSLGWCWLITIVKLGNFMEIYWWRTRHCTFHVIHLSKLQLHAQYHIKVCVDFSSTWVTKIFHFLQAVLLLLADTIEVILICQPQTVIIVTVQSLVR